MRVDAEITDSGTLKVALVDTDGKVMVIEKTLAANEWKRVKKLLTGGDDET